MLCNALMCMTRPGLLVLLLMLPDRVDVFEVPSTPAHDFKRLNLEFCYDNFLGLNRVSGMAIIRGGLVRLMVLESAEVLKRVSTSTGESICLRICTAICLLFGCTEGLPC